MFATKTGTMPGAPLADLVFQFAFAHFLGRVHARLRELGLLMSVHQGRGNPQHVPSPTWMDDIVVPVDADSADTLVPRAQQLIQVVSIELANIGIQINTGPGKSEALLHFAGHGSRRVRHHWLIQQNATIPVNLAGGAAGRVQIVANYTHLGSTVSFDRTPQLDIKKRSAAARETRRRIHRPLLTNQHLTISERLTMHWSLVVRKFLHGAGLWTFRLDRDFSSFSAAYLSLIRPICLPVLGLAAKGLDDDTVCAICGYPSARLLRDLELVAMAAAVGSKACDALCVLMQDSVWIEEVAAAWKRVCRPDSCLTAMALLEEWRMSPLQTVATVRSARRKCRVACQSAQPDAIRRARHQLSNASTGWICIDLASTTVCTRFQCGICGQHCASASGLAVHQLHSHGQNAAAGIAGSATLCPVCGVEYWETHRLRDHLRKNPTCLVPLVESDVEFPGRSKTSHSQRAWRPAVRVPFVQPFWATLRPDPTPANPCVSGAFSSSIQTSLDSLDQALRKQHSPKEALSTLIARVRGAADSTECVSDSIVPQDHPLFSFVDFAFWVCSSEDLGIYDGIGFRAARCQGKVLIRFAESSERNCTDPALSHLVRMLV